METVKSMDRS
jgi:5'-AMP-activated protein kinase catalytic alpha subunit